MNIIFSLQQTWLNKKQYDTRFHDSQEPSARRLKMKSLLWGIFILFLFFNFGACQNKKMKELKDLASSLHEEEENEEQPESVPPSSYGRLVVIQENESTERTPFTPDDDPDSITAEEKENFILSLFQESNEVRERTYGTQFLQKKIEKSLGTSFQYLGLEKSESHYNFCEIDTQFVETFRDLFPIPKPEDHLSLLSTLSYAEIYNREYGIKNNLRSYASSFYILMQNEEEFRQIAQKWVDLQNAEAFVQTYRLADEVKDHGSRVKSQAAQTFQASDIDPGTINVYQVDFWVRRMIDGSAFSLWSLLYDVMEKYDGNWLETLLKITPPLGKILSPQEGRILENLKIRKSPTLSAPILGTLQAGTDVLITARSDKKTQIDGLLDYWLLVNTEDSRGWVYGGYVAITSEVDKEFIHTFYYNIERSQTELAPKENEVMEMNPETRTDSETREEGVLRGIVYKLTEDGYFVNGHTQSLPRNVVIESEIAGMEVTKISVNAFADEKDNEIVTVKIPSTIMTIHGNPFSGCSHLESIEVDPENAYYRSDEGILYNKEKTQLIAYPAGRNDSLFTIPDGVVSIGTSAFSKSKNLEKIRFPDTVSHIGDWGFQLSGLTEVSLPRSVTTVGGWTFFGCHNLRKVTLPKNLVSIGNVAFSGCLELEEIQIPQGVQEIGHSAFAGCPNLQEITIPDSVTDMGDWAFGRCEALTINCYIQSMPVSWSYYWNKSDEKDKGRPVNWGWEEFN